MAKNQCHQTSQSPGTKCVITEEHTISRIVSARDTRRLEQLQGRTSRLQGQNIFFSLRHPNLRLMLNNERFENYNVDKCTQ